MALILWVACWIRHRPFWISLIVWRHVCLNRLAGLVPFSTHIASRNDLPSKQVLLLSGFPNPLLTTSTSGSIVKYIHSSLFADPVGICWSRFEGLSQIMLSHFNRKWLGVKIVKILGRQLLLSGVLRWELALQNTLLYWANRRWGFSGCRLRSLLYYKLEPVIPIFHQSVALQEGWTSKQSFSQLLS